MFLSSFLLLLLFSLISMVVFVVPAYTTNVLDIAAVCFFLRVVNRPPFGDCSSVNSVRLLLALLLLLAK
jgi:hypothetical protein